MTVGSLCSKMFLTQCKKRKIEMYYFKRNPISYTDDLCCIIRISYIIVTKYF